MLYLDNSATTPILPEVKEAMLPFLLEEFGNPSSKYYSVAENAKEAVNKARTNIADFLKCDKNEIIFTSGSTESNNMIIKGVADYYKEKGNHIITSKVEHPSVLETCKFLETKGFKVTYLDVDQFGRVDVDELAEAIETAPPILVSIMWGNNEIGSLNNIPAIANLCEEHDIFFHTDATQVAGKVPIDLSEHPGITFLSLSGHKVHGPKGIGIAFIRTDNLGLPRRITPLLHGGGQENEYRSGTLAVHNIVGIGKAIEIASKSMNKNSKLLKELEQSLTSILKEKFSEYIVFNNDQKDTIPGIISVQFKGVNNELLLKNISSEIAASTGSACSSSKPSHVLKAIGLSDEEIRNTVRFSMSPYIKICELNVFKTL